MTGRIRLSGIDVLALNEKELEELRWRKISVVFQGAMNALNPVQRIGDQLLEPIHLHEKETSTTEGRGRVRSCSRRSASPATARATTRTSCRAACGSA